MVIVFAPPNKPTTQLGLYCYVIVVGFGHGKVRCRSWTSSMSKPLDDPTRWIGAYSALTKEKWDYLLDGFKNCPIAEPANDFSGAYAWFVKNPQYLGLDEGNSAPSWMRNVLGVRCHTYSWGFRGADPADYYGEGYTEYDFDRLHMYRDVNVYKEIGRRAKILCNDLDASLGGGLVSFNQWEAAARASMNRRLLSQQEGGYKNRGDRKRHLKEVVPDLTQKNSSKSLSLVKKRTKSNKLRLNLVRPSTQLRV